jgi:hypothetical protein
MSKKKKPSKATINQIMQAVMKIAFYYGWDYIDYQDDIEMISYSREDCRMNIYLTTMTVATALNHPYKGKTQLFRKNVSLNLLEKLMMYPRLHTKKGYYTKKINNHYYGQTSRQENRGDKKGYSSDADQSSQASENNERQGSGESYGNIDPNQGTLQTN